MAETLSDLLEADRADAWAYFDRLAAIYAAELRRLAREAVTRFHRSQWAAPVLAAGTPAEWHIPDPDELIDAAKAAGELAGKTRKLREEIAQTSVGGTLAAYGINFDLRNPLIQGVLSQMGQHITQIVEDERSRIMASLNDSWEQGLSIRDAALAMKSDSVIESRMRAEMIARTELTGATNSGSLAAVRLVNDASPPDTRMSKIWIATNDERTRETHSEASGQYGPGSGIPLTEPFNVGGFDLQHPGDPSGPPEEVINCRCTIGYEQPGGGTVIATPPAEPITEPTPEPVAPEPLPTPVAAERTAANMAKDLVATAKREESQVTNDLQTIVRANGGEMGGLDFRLKTEQSLAGKLERKAREKHITVEEYSQSVADVLRYTGVFKPADYATGVERTLERLRKAGYQFDDSDIENYWATGDDYNGINMTLRTRGGYRFELQFHTPESLALKNGDLHRLYELFRDEHNPHERHLLWNQMTELSNRLPQPDAAALRIGTRTIHAAPSLPHDPTALARSLIESAMRRDPQVTSDLAAAITGHGGEMAGLDFRVKSEESLIRKLTLKGPLDPVAYSLRVADVLRYTGTFDPAEYAAGVERAISDLRAKGYTIHDADIENYWEPGDDYNGININIATPDGYRFELQFHTPESFRLKNGELHRIYAEYRTSTDPFIRRQLWDQMVALSDRLQLGMDVGKLATIRRIGTLTRHTIDIAHGIDEIDAATGVFNIDNAIREGTAAWDAIQAYIGTGYDRINEYLRHGTQDGDSVANLQALIDEGDKAVLSSPRAQALQATLREIKEVNGMFVPSDKAFIAYRGYKKAVLDAHSSRVDLTDLIGKTIQDPGIVSTTAARNVAEDFAQFGVGSADRVPADRVVMELAIPKGMPTLNISRVEHHPNTYEQEILLPPGTKYRVTSVRRDAEGRYIVRAIVEKP